MTENLFEDNYGSDVRPLGLLCRRLEFPTFYQMVACLLEVDSSEVVVFDAINECITTYINTESKDHRIFPGSRGDRTVTLLRFLLEANLGAIKNNSSYALLLACEYLRGELGVAVLSLFIAKESGGLKKIHSSGCLPIHSAAIFSSVDVLKLLQSVYPESLTMLASYGNTLLHKACYGHSKDITNMRDKV
jgi:hypothetical protein